MESVSPARDLGRVGHYRLLELIGVGGMGRVFRAVDENLERLVAVKLLPPGLLQEPQARARFRKEACALSRLNHTNITAVYEFDTESGQDFLVMEYAAGSTLREKLASGLMPEHDVVRIGLELAAGLAAAHQQGVVHCDLKPENLMLSRAGQIKILDFGLAKLLENASAESTTSGMTAAGTLPYMSPEQVRGEPADARSDLWATGVLLYEMVTGKRPFTAGGLEVVGEILHSVPEAPSRLLAQISPAFESLVLRCLEKNPDRRYQSAGELRAALEAISHGFTQAQPAAPRKKFSVLFVALLIVGTLTTLWLVNRIRTGTTSEQTVPIRSVAVLPMVNLSHDPEQEYFADGMTEALITDLSNITGLKVISRTSTLRYKNTQKSIPEIARDLHVDVVVEGSVLKEGNRVRISSQLIEGRTDRHLWADSYDRNVVDVLALQADVASRLAEHMRLQLRTPESISSTRARVNPEAYDLWLRGNYQGNKIDEASFRRRIELYRKALAIDSNFAPAHADLSFGLITLATWNQVAAQAVCGEAETEARRALELDPVLAAAHTALADTYLYCHFDWHEAEQEYLRAIEINPNYSGAHYDYSFLLAFSHRYDEAVAEAERAKDLDPMGMRMRSALGYIYYFARRYDDAVRELKAALDLEPGARYPNLLLSIVYKQQGKEELAVEALCNSYAVPDRQRDAEFRDALSRGGMPAVNKVRLRRMLAISQNGFISPTTIAALYLLSGESSKSLDWLEKAMQARDVQVLDITVDPRYDPLRSNPKFQRLIAQLGFPD